MEKRITPNSTKIASKWALIYTATAIVITYGTELLNLDPNSAVKYFTFLPFIAFMCLAQTEFREELGGYMSYGNGFSAGFRYALFSGLLLGIFSYLYFAYLSPGMWEKVLQATQTSMEQQNQPTEQIDKTMEFMRGTWGLVMGAFSSAVMYAIIGAIISLITAAIFKKERSPYDIAMAAEDQTTDPTV